MPKVKINGYLKNYTEKITNFYCLDGVIKNSSIEYQEDDGTVLTLTIKGQCIELHRVSKETEMLFYFENGEILDGIYKANNYGFNVKTITRELEIEKQRILIKYKLLIDNKEIGLFEYQIEYKE